MSKDVEIQEFNVDPLQAATLQKVVFLDDLTLAIIGGGDMTVNF